MENKDIIQIVKPGPLELITLHEHIPRPERARNEESVDIMMAVPVEWITFRDEHKRRRTKQKITPRKVPTICKECSKVFANSNKFDKHKCSTYETICCRCWLQFTHAHDRRRHEKTCMREKKPIQCRYCGKSFSRKDSMERHVKRTCKKKVKQASGSWCAPNGPFQGRTS